MGLLGRIADLIYPPKCPFCRTLLADETPVCHQCGKTILSLTVGQTEGEWFSGCLWAIPYRDEYRDAILRFKFEGTRYYSRAFGLVLAQAIQRQGISWDVITWTPVSAKRRRERGYDQAELLANQTAALLGARPVRLLEKVKHTPAQSGMDSATARKSNIKGAYEARNPELISGKKVLLIDDIVTTASTLSECSKTLLKAGAESVWCAALAGTELSD